MSQNVVLTIFHTQNIDHHVWTTVRTTLQCIGGLQLGGEGHKMEKIYGTNLPIVFLAFQAFSSGLENNKISNCDSKSFSCMVEYILCVKICQSKILTHSCLPIAGRLFYNVRTLHGPRILECNIIILNDYCTGSQSSQS